MSKKKSEIINQLTNWFIKHPSYLKKGLNWIDQNHKFDKEIAPSDITLAKAYARVKLKSKQDYLNQINVAKLKTSFNKIITKSKLNKDNVIFIPDLHAPFIKEGVLDWIKEEQIRYNCGTVIFAGDIIDGHAWSYHEHDPDGLSVGDELEAAKNQLKDWYKAFPKAICLLGNHDLLISRKAKSAGLSKKFIRDFGHVIEAPNTWEFKFEHIENNILYHHGSIGDAFKVAKDRRISTCQGHLHSKTFVQWAVSDVDAIFGLQVGWGADRDKYAFDYGKSFVSKPVLSCGIILDKGKTPIVKLMPL